MGERNIMQAENSSPPHHQYSALTSLWFKQYNWPIHTMLSSGSEPFWFFKTSGLTPVQRQTIALWHKVFILS